MKSVTFVRRIAAFVAGCSIVHCSLSAGRIYCNDPPERPFASDASKFALFGAAGCQLLAEDRLGKVDVIHLHDWHAAFAAMLIRSDPRYALLGDARLVVTIHNLAMQGIRPFARDDSSLDAWFPGLKFDRKAIADPRYPNCFNPLRAAINLCDKVHTVSPAYAREIRKSINPRSVSMVAKDSNATCNVRIRQAG